MNGRRLISSLAATAFVVAMLAPATRAHAQPLPAYAPSPSPSPQPHTRAEDEAAIVRPLSEIGRVRSRTPYCGALARVREAIDSAITFEYGTNTLANDLRRFRLDSQLTRAQSRNKAERDLSKMTDLALAGRAQVAALRTAANGAGVDPEKRKEMLEFADALDSAKVRQLELAKSAARIVAVLAETPIRDITNTAADDHGARAGRGKDKPLPVPGDTPAPLLSDFVASTGDAVVDTGQLNALFNAFVPERLIRDDLKNAAAHGNKAVQLGNCTGV